MATEDGAVEVLKQSRKRSKKLKKIEEKNSCSGLEDEIVDAYKGFEEGNFTERTRNEDVERRRKKKKRKLEGVEKENMVAEITDVWNEASVEMATVKKKKKKREKEKKNNDDCAVSMDKDNIARPVDELNEDCVEIGQTKKKKKKKEKEKEKEKEKSNNDTGAESVDKSNNGGRLLEDFDGGKKGVKCNADEYKEVSVKKVTTKKKKKKENEKNIRRSGPVEDVPKDRKLQKNKRVRFADEVEVFHISDVPKKGKEKMSEEELVQGKPFSEEEDEIIREAIYKYIEKYELGDEGLDMVLNCKKSSNLKGCWKEISAAIPYRPYRSVYFRAQKLVCSSNKRWTEEELELLRQYQAKHGNSWSVLADELGRFRAHVCNAWLRIKLPNRKKGGWSQDEYQTLFDLVNANLQMRVCEEKKSNHGMLRDNICWKGIISEKLTTRNNKDCCLKWYRQLTSPMVAEGSWSDSDDYRLVGALYELDSSCMENVDWDNLLEHRSGEVCLQRWKQMIRHIGNQQNKSFGEQVEILAQRYCPNLLETREAWDNKPYAPSTMNP